MRKRNARRSPRKPVSGQCLTQARTISNAHAATMSLPLPYALHLAIVQRLTLTAGAQQFAVPGTGCAGSQFTQYREAPRYGGGCFQPADASR